jgi:hypothetical protein
MVPFGTQVPGVDVPVDSVELAEDGKIVAVCSRGRFRQAIPIPYLPLPSPPPDGAEWVEAYRFWATAWGRDREGGALHRTCRCGLTRASGTGSRMPTCRWPAGTRLCRGWNDRCEPFIWTKTADEIILPATGGQGTSFTRHWKAWAG